ncbi:uncharacterized protein J3D65DRAFT_606601 [Phyllosticta citribraziliensis]|uniref:DUF4259 domain-containing protein n=1 Tax=Phyllosticta citribraziliensis TaxID=989973 RepID=A0ABR1LA62_9PEZI
MGFWGTGVFQSDRDLDFLDNLAAALKVDNLYYPEKPDEVRAQLNDGRLQAEFEKLREAERTKTKTVHFEGIKTAIVLLGAAAMELGANLGEEHKAYMSIALRTHLLGMYDQAKRDILKGLEDYQNGKPREVAGKGLDETMCNPPPNLKPNSMGFIGMNVPDPSFFGGLETILGEKK